MRLRINIGTVVHETIDDETIVIHMRTGSYYSLEAGAAELWSLIESQVDRRALLEYAEKRWAGDPSSIRDGVAALLDELLTEDLLVAADDDEHRAAAAVPGAPPRVRFSPLVLHKFTDMQDFMLVDPLHDVDAGAGWPHVGTG